MAEDDKDLLTKLEAFKLGVTDGVLGIIQQPDPIDIPDDLKPPQQGNAVQPMAPAPPAPPAPSEPPELPVPEPK